MFINRPFWQTIIEKTWLEKSIIWLMGVRRIGKTSLCRSLDLIEYFDCERPSVRQLLANPESFLESKIDKRIVLDEIHRLDNPSEFLKLAADHYPSVKIIATGSSTLGAGTKFKDTLVDRKRDIWLTPLLLEEIKLFGNYDLRHRFLFGGFPSHFVQKEFPEKSFQEWIYGYWDKDIEGLFRVGKRASFLKFADLLLANSGGQFEASKYATVCEVSRQTIANYLQVLHETFIVDIVTPYSSRKSIEIVKAPKIYGFDTGFVCYAKGWHNLREDDLGILWEHCVLNEMRGHLGLRTIKYWRDKADHEIDFILPVKGRNSQVIAIECKFRSSETNLRGSVVEITGRNIKAFRQAYPDGPNFVVASDVDHSFERQYEDVRLTFVNTENLIKKLSEI